MKTGQAISRSGAELAEYYRELLEEQAASELSVTEFAAEVGISAGTLYSWRRRLGESTEGDEADGLIEVQVTGDGIEVERGASIVLQVDNRIQIELDADFDDGALERLLRVLSRC